MILLTALPRTGKSTAIAKIVAMLGKKNCGGFYTEEIRENGERVGFKIKSLNGEEGILAYISLDSKYKISKYGVDLDTFEKICLKEIERAISSDYIKYIIIDEIGPMQLFSEKYKKMLIDLTKFNKPVIGTIFYNPYEWLDDFKKNQNVKLVELNFENRNQMPLKIVSEVNVDESLTKKIKKAKRYSKEQDRFNFFENKIKIFSEHGTRTITKNNGNYTCDCEYYKDNGTCSHIIATIIK